MARALSDNPAGIYCMSSNAFSMSDASAGLIIRFRGQSPVLKDPALHIL
jgi:hypothetical protein